MKQFRKKHDKIPSKETVERLIRMKRPDLLPRYRIFYQTSSPCLPEEIRVCTLASIDTTRRTHILYYPDFKNFTLYDAPNRRLPIAKFLAMFQPYYSPNVLTQLEHNLTAFQLKFYTSVEDWLAVYSDETIHTCMSGRDDVKCYVHPQNKLALAALYAPGGTSLVARTIVNTDEKWWVRIFGDGALMADKLIELGYYRRDKPPAPFRMYAIRSNEGSWIYPYFDFRCTAVDILHETYNEETNMAEIIVNG